MRLKSLAQLERREPREIPLGTLPCSIRMALYARDKAFEINELVRSIHGDSLEWYGFTMGTSDTPDLVADIGLPINDLNLRDYTTLSPRRIAEFQESLPGDVVINGWIHSHGALQYKRFSDTDERNHRVVLDFVAAGLKRQVAKREIPIRDLVFLLKDRFVDEDLARGSVSLITDAPITSATLMEAIWGSFCYAVVIGDEGWHEQEIHYKKNGVVSGFTALSSRKDAEITLVETGRLLSQYEVRALTKEVKERIQPNKNPPVEMMERM